MTPRTVACQGPLSIEFPRQEYWSDFPFPTPGDLPNPGTEPEPPASQADSLPLWLLGSSFIQNTEREKEGGEKGALSKEMVRS